MYIHKYTYIDRENIYVYVQRSREGAAAGACDWRAHVLCVIQMHACMYVCIFVIIYVYIFVCMYVYIFVCIGVCKYVSGLEDIV